MSETKSKWPPAIPYIVGNEAAERFSFYGMKAILFVYLTQLFKIARDMGQEVAESTATHDVHIFVAGVYAFPMLGALIADRLFGKFRVIMWLSIVYCAGHAVLAVASPMNSVGLFYFGLGLIAVGSGGIKPCVSAMVGDQFDSSNKNLVTKVYQIFYFSINFGSFFSTLLTPWLYKNGIDGYGLRGAELAFGVPGVFMGIATIIFWLGRKKFKRVPPNPGGKLGLLDALSSTLLFVPVGLFLFGEGINFWVKTGLGIAGLVVWFLLFSYRLKLQQDKGFFAVLVYALKNQDKRKKGDSFFDVARDELGNDAAEGPPAVLRIGIVFSAVSVFWALFDQHASSWVNQATKMELILPNALPIVGGVEVEASQISALNPVMVMLLIPLMGGVVYPLVEKIGIKLTPLRKMTTGMCVASLAFVTVALLQQRIDSSPPNSVNVFWQVIPYLIMTLSEVLVSITGLEFAYTQAPRSMKSTIMGFWLLTVAFGNKLVAVVAVFEGLSLESFFWLFAAFMAGAAVIFGILAYFYKGKTYLQEDEVPASES